MKFHARSISRIGESVMRRPLFASLFLFVALCGGVTSAQQKSPLVPLPQLNECQSAAHPHLPSKWHAIFLMAPFTNAQLVLSDI
jgi:hypothetical protein